MRDPNRLLPFYVEMADIHAKHFPDWRFGQLCSNFFGWLMSEKGIDIFFPEGDEMMKFFREYMDMLEPETEKEEKVDG